MDEGPNFTPRYLCTLILCQSASACRFMLYKSTAWKELHSNIFNLRPPLSDGADPSAHAMHPNPNLSLGLRLGCNQERPTTNRLLVSMSPGVMLQPS